MVATYMTVTPGDPRRTIAAGPAAGPPWGCARPPVSSGSLGCKSLPRLMTAEGAIPSLMRQAEPPAALVGAPSERRVIADDSGKEPHEAVRVDDRGRRPLLRRAARTGHRIPRSQRCRQVDHHADDPRARRPDPRPGTRQRDPVPATPPSPPGGRRPPGR